MIYAELAFQITLALAATIEAAARAALGDVVFAVYFLVVALAAGVFAERTWRRLQRHRKGWS